MEGYNLWPLKLVTNLYRLARGSQGADFLHLRESPSDSSTPTCAEGVVSFVKSLLPAPNRLPDPVSEKSIQIPPSVEKPIFPIDPFKLSLHTHTPVTSVTSVSARIAPMYDVHTPRGTIRTPFVVYATNAYTSRLLPHLTGPNGIVPVRSQGVAIRADVGYVHEGDAQGITRTAWKGMFALTSFVPLFLINPLFSIDRQRRLRVLVPSPSPFSTYSVRRETSPNHHSWWWERST